MSKPIVVLQLDQPTLTKDTKVEVTSTGELDVLDNAPQQLQNTIGALVDQATQGFRETVFDRKRDDEFAHHLDEAVEALGAGAQGEVYRVVDRERPGRALVAKVFHGSGYSQLMKLFKDSFRTAKAIKPKASRDKSAETFFVGIGPKLQQP